MKGVPLRIEMGPRDIEAGKMLFARRDTLEKVEVAREGAAASVKEMLQTIQKNLLVKARAHRDSRIVYADDMAGILAGVEAGNFVKAGWCGCRACEDRVKEQTAATSRVIVEDESAETCAVCGKPAKNVIIYARAY